MPTKVTIMYPNRQAGTFDRLVSEPVDEVVQKLNNAAERPWTWLTHADSDRKFGVRPGDVTIIRDADMPED